MFCVQQCNKIYKNIITHPQKKRVSIHFYLIRSGDVYTVHKQRMVCIDCFLSFIKWIDLSSVVGQKKCVCTHIFTCLWAIETNLFVDAFSFSIFCRSLVSVISRRQFLCVLKSNSYFLFFSFICTFTRITSLLFSVSYITLVFYPFDFALVLFFHALHNKHQAATT